MKSLIRIILILIFAIEVVMPAFGQISSFPLKSGNANPSGEGFIYALPLDIVKVEVFVTKTEHYKGKYSEYASRLLGLPNVITKDEVTYRIDDVKLSTINDVDTDHYYYAEFPKKFNTDQTFMVNLSEKGFITSLYSTKSKDKELIKQNLPGVPFSDLLKPVLIEKVDTIIRRVSIDTTIIEEKILKRSISEKSIEQQAREIADLIYRIEDSKFSLITGYQEVNYSKESMEYMLHRLNTMEQEYIAYFKGSQLTSEEKYTYYYTPEKSGEESMMTLFRFSPKEGIMDKNSTTGEGVSVYVTSLNKLSSIRNFENSRMQQKRNSFGLFYRIPEEAKIELHMGANILASNKAYISQMGIVSFLPANNLSKADFHTNGALKLLILD